MGDRLLQEQLRIIDELEARADGERRSWSFTAQLAIANLGLALAPRVPQAERVFGALSGSLALMIVIPCFLPVFVSLFLYRRWGAKRRWYRGFDALEAFSLYAIPLLFIAVSGLPWSVLWALCPFSAIFFALTKPFRGAFYATLIATSHTALALALVALGNDTAGVVCVGVGAVALAAFVTIARSQRNAVLAEADRNVARTGLAQRQLDEERDRIASSLTSGVAQELSALAKELSAATRGDQPSLALVQATKQAQAALLELGAITAEGRSATLPRSLGELAVLLERKLGALCVNAEYRQVLVGNGAAAIAPATALALLRIGQELVRNAITHGAARTVTVELAQLGHEVGLAVTDDGSGLRDERLRSATGGLDNVRRWLQERSGRLQRSSPADKRSGTVLRVTMPLVP
ncbi:MAG: hypothetical protein Q8K32_20930 [Archangium sp.]|nr:hypothetical protein [Archangium sp.]